MSWTGGQLNGRRNWIGPGHGRLTSLWDSDNAYEPMEPMTVFWLWGSQMGMGMIDKVEWNM